MAETNFLPMPKRTMLVAQESGKTYQVDFTEFPHLDDPTLIDWDLSVSKLLIGKFQMNRTRFVSIDELAFENVVHTNQFPEGATSDLEITLFYTLDGKNPQAAVFPIPAVDSGGYIQVATRLTGQNISVQLRGTYNVNTLTITSHNHGRR